MQWLPGFTDFFMSPVTGRINLSAFPDLTDDYIWIGDPNDRPISSPIIIDLRLEIIDLRNRLSETRFILQTPSAGFDSSQALDQLVNGILKHDTGVVEIAVPGTDYMLPSLTYKNVWIGDVTNKPAEFPRIQVENLPTMLNSDPFKLLGAYNLYSGSSNPLSLGEPEIILRINITNLPDLTVGKLWYGTDSSNPLNFGSNRPVEITVLPLTNMADLPTDNVWVGDGSNRPAPSPMIPISVLPNLPTDNVWVGDAMNRPVPSTVIPGGSLPDLAFTYIWIGDASNRPVASPHIEIGNLPDLATNNFWVGDGTNRPVAVTVIPDDALPDLAYTNIWIGSVTNRPVASPNIEVLNLPNLTDTYLWLGDGGNRPVEVPHIEIENLPDLTWTYIWRGDITGRPQESFDLTSLEVFTIPGIQADIVAINLAIGVIQGQILVIQGQITVLEGAVAGLLTSVGILQGQVVVLQGQIVALGIRIDNLRLNTISADADVSFYNFKIINLANPVDPTDGANKAYVDSAIAAGTIVLTGAVTGSGVVGTPVATDLSQTITVGGDFQKFQFASDFSKFQVSNSFVPVSGTPSETNIELRNNVASGYRFSHTTSIADASFGGLSIKTFISDVESQTLISIDEGLSLVINLPVYITGGLSIFSGPIIMDSFPINNLAMDTFPASTDAVNVAYLNSQIAAGTIVLTGNVTGSGFVGTSFATTLNMTLDTIPLAVANVNLNSHKIINLLDPTAAQDGATKNYVDSVLTTITLTGNVTGSGTTGTPFATTLNMTLDTIPLAAANVNINTHKLTNVVNPTAAQDAATKNYVDTSITAGTIVLTGNVTGSGVVGTSFATTLALSLDQITLAAANVNINTHKLINVVNPTAAQDAATKNYVDTSIAAGTIVLTGNVTGSGVVGTPFATTLALSLDQITIAAANVNLNSHKITNLSTPTAGTDAANKTYVDSAIAAGTIVLTGNVTGSGVVGTPFATTLALSLDQITIAAANVNLNSHKITNLLTPTTGTDAANKSYVDSAIAAGTITLTGAVTGTGVVGTSFATALSQTITVGGVNQFFNFSDPISVFILHNSFVPTAPNPNNLYLDFTNNNSDGYRLRQTTIFGGAGSGSFFLDQVVATVPTNLMGYSASLNAFTFVPDTNFTGTVFCNGAAPALKFPNSTLNRKISLFESVANDHQYFGFGVNSFILRYQVPGTTSDHVFYAGTSSSASNEVGRITGTGNFIIPGTSYSTIIHGCINMQANATGFTANSTWTKVAGTTALKSGNEFTMPSNNRLTYTGTTQASIKTMVCATISFGYNSILGDVIKFALYKNATILNFYLPITNTLLNGQQTVHLENEVDLTTNDYVEIWANSSGGSTITVSDMSLRAIRV